MIFLYINKIIINLQTINLIFISMLMMIYWLSMLWVWVWVWVWIWVEVEVEVSI